MQSPLLLPDGESSIRGSNSTLHRCNGFADDIIENVNGCDYVPLPEYRMLHRENASLKGRIVKDGGCGQHVQCCNGSQQQVKEESGIARFLE